MEKVGAGKGVMQWDDHESSRRRLGGKRDTTHRRRRKRGKTNSQICIFAVPLKKIVKARECYGDSWVREGKGRLNHGWKTQPTEQGHGDAGVLVNRRRSFGG